MRNARPRMTALIDAQGQRPLLEGLDEFLTTLGHRPATLLRTCAFRISHVVLARLRHFRHRARPRRHRDDRHGGSHDPAGLCLYGRALRPIRADTRAWARAHRSVYREGRQEGERHGAGARRSEPGGLHPGQCGRHHRRRRLLPGARCCPRLLRGVRFGAGAPHAHHDEHPHRRRLDGSRRVAVPPRRNQRAAAAG